MAVWTVVASLDSPTAGVFDFPSLTLTSYSVIQVIGSGITVTTDGTNVLITVYQGGSEITTLTYRWGLHADVSSGGAGNTDADVGSGKVNLVSDDVNWDVGNASGEGIGFVATFDDPGGSLMKRCSFEAALTNPSGALLATEGVSYQSGTGAIGGIKVKGSSSLTAGKVRILGLA